MGVNKFDATGLQVSVDATLMGQGVTPQGMGLSAPQVETSAPAVSSQPAVLPGLGR